MKKLILLLISMVSVQSQALTVKITGPCSEKPVYEARINANLNKSIGQISQEHFDSQAIPYEGTAAGFYSILGSQTGMAAVEIVAENEMRAYGWCYSVNGNVAGVMPDKMRASSQNDVIEWFYGYSTHKNFQWSTEPCAPGFKIKADQFCK